MQRDKLLRIASTASVLTAMVLIVVKLVAWVMTESVSIMASLIDSLLDAAASMVNFFAIRYALLPPDDEHRFGHGKAEAVAGLMQSAFISGSAIFLLLQAADRLLHPRELQSTQVGVAVMIFSIIATLGLVIFQKYVVKKTGSTAIHADSLHYVGDLLGNATVIIALVLSQYGWNAADPVMAIAVGLYILYSAWEIGKESFEHLMDRELPDDEKDSILEIAMEPVEVIGVHELKTRRSGHRYIIQLHLEMLSDLSLRQAHDAADKVERRLRKAFPGADVITHQDPADIVEPGQGYKEAEE